MSIESRSSTDVDGLFPSYRRIAAEIDLSAATNILGTDWDQAETSPSLEQIAAADLAANGITPVTKKLWLDSSTYPELPVKVEGVAIVDGRELVLINDDDFGIEGAKTRIVRITMPKAAF